MPTGHSCGMLPTTGLILFGFHPRLFRFLEWCRDSRKFVGSLPMDGGVSRRTLQRRRGAVLKSGGLSDGDSRLSKMARCAPYRPL